MTFSIMLCTCVNDVQAATLVSTYNIEPFEVTRSFTLATGTLDNSYSINETGTISGTTSDSNNVVTVVSGTYNSISNVDSYIYGEESYLIDCNYTVTIDSGARFIYNRNYDVSVGISSVTPILTGYSGVNIDILSEEICVLISGQKFYLNDFTGGGFYGTGFSGNSFVLQINTKYLCTTSTTIMADEFCVGYSVGNVYGSVIDCGAVDSGIIDSINSGNTIQSEGNQLQQEANDLQEDQNETTNNIFSSISDFFGSFFDNLIGIFVPEDGYFEDFFARLNRFFSEKLGMLYSPIELFINLLTGIQSASAVDAGIPFPGLKWEDMYIIEPQTISLSEIVADFPELQRKIYFVTNVIMVGSILMLLQNKLKEILST